jgi:putative addiction module killer protein
MKIVKSDEFNKWFDKLDNTLKTRVTTRLGMIQNYGHLGDHKSVGDGVSELRWRIALRVYFVIAIDESSGKKFVCLMGGAKDEQSVEIRKAKEVAKKFKTP